MKSVPMENASTGLKVLETGTITAKGTPFTLAIMGRDYLDHAIELHQKVIERLEPEEKTFILPRTREYFERPFKAGGGNALFGVFENDTDLIAKCTILHPAPDATAADLAGAMLSSPPGQTSILQAATVLPEYRNMGLMRLMIRHWLAHAQSYGKTHVHAEIEVRNAASWNGFLKAGLNIVKVGRSPIDGAQVYSAEERIKYAMMRQLEPSSMCDKTALECAATDIDTQKKYMDAGYVVTDLREDRQNLILKKPVG